MAYPRYQREFWPFVAHREHLGDSVGLALDTGLDRAVTSIAYPTIESQFAGLRNHPATISDALDSPLDLDMNTLLHLAIPRMPTTIYEPSIG